MTLSGKEAAELARAESDKIRKKLEDIVKKQLDEKKLNTMRNLKSLRLNIMVDVFEEIRGIIAKHYNIELTKTHGIPNYCVACSITTPKGKTRFMILDVYNFLSVFPEELNQNKELRDALQKLDTAIQTVGDKLSNMQEREISNIENKKFIVDIVRKAMYAIGIALGITSVICISAIISPVSAVAAALGVTAGAVTVGGVSAGLGTAAGATAVAGAAIAAIAGNFLGKNLKRRFDSQIDAEIDPNIVKNFIDIIFEKYQLCHKLAENLKSQSAELGGESTDRAVSSLGAKVTIDKKLVDRALAPDDKGVERE